MSKEPCNLLILKTVKKDLREMLAETTGESISTYLTKQALRDIKKHKKEKNA